MVFTKSLLSSILLTISAFTSVATALPGAPGEVTAAAVTTITAAAETFGTQTSIALQEAVTSITAQSSTATSTSTSTATSSDTCNPLSSTSCSADTALATSISLDFSSEETDYFSVYQSSGDISYSSDGVSLTMNKRFDNPSLQSDFYMMFGKVEVLLKSSNGTGIVSSFYLQSDDLDEIDLEWFGGDASQVQTNFFSKGDTTTYDRGEYHNMSDPRADYHNYTIEWTEESLTWYLDGTALRTLTNDTSSGYPQTPMKVFFGLWAGGDSSNSEGTIEWAGGSTDYSDAPFAMFVKKLVVSDYSTGSSYSYSDQTGDWTSITSDNGEINGRVSLAQKEFAALASGEDISSGSSSSSASSSTLSKTTKRSSTGETTADSTSALDTASSNSATTTSDSAAATQKSSTSKTTLITITTSSSSLLSSSYSSSSITNGTSSITSSDSGASKSTTTSLISLLSLALFGVSLF